MKAVAGTTQPRQVDARLDSLMKVCAKLFSGLTTATLIPMLLWALNVSVPTAAAPASAPEKPARVSKDEKEAALKPVIENAQPVTTEELVTSPQSYLGKDVKFKAKFSSFSNLALDYKPAYRSSKTHFSFLVLRPDSQIPFSELKLAMEIPKEKDPDATTMATLKGGDEIEVIGKVFSSALDEPWVDVYNIKQLSEKKKKRDAEAGNGADDTNDKSSEENEEE